MQPDTHYCLWSCLTDAVRSDAVASRKIRGIFTSKTHFKLLQNECIARVCCLRYLQTRHYTAEEYSAFKNVWLIASMHNDITM